MKHEYKISINRECKKKDPFIYKFGQTPGIELHVAKYSATVRVTMTVEKTHEQLKNFEVGPLKDGYRKLFLLHALLFDKDFKVNSVIMSIDGDEMEYGEEDMAGHPFIYSMISTKEMHLPDSWKSRGFCQALVEKCKSKSDLDRADIAVNAFLMSKGRLYLTDRFSNLWTSMNAYYNYISELYNDYIREKFYSTKPILKKLKKMQKDKQSDVYSKNRVTKMKLFGSKEQDKQTFFIQCIDQTACKLDSSAFKGLEKEENRGRRHEFERKLAKLSYAKMSELYDYSIALLNGAIPQKEDEFWKFHELSEEMGQKLFFFLIMEYPYYCRCEYLHGGKALMLLAYENEFDISVLRAAGYFVERFLEEKIPEMVEGKFEIPEELLKEREKLIFYNNKGNPNGNKQAIEEYVKEVEKLISEGKLTI